METHCYQTNKPRGLLLVGHGTHDEQGRHEFLRTAELLAERDSGVLVQPCYLEIAEPAISAGVRRLAERGATHLTVVPLLLFGAGHAKRDIPDAVRQAVEGTHFKTIDYARHLGCHPSLLEQSRRRCQQAVAGLAAVNREESLLLLVGRGSNDPEATAEMHRFADLCCDTAMFQHTRTAFLALARPRLADVVEEVQSLAVRRVVVQPHLLFCGDLLTSLRQCVQRLAGRPSDQQWLLAQHLGPTSLLVEAIWNRYLQGETGQGF